jgi:hypothetical protein
MGIRSGAAARVGMHLWAAARGAACFAWVTAGCSLLVSHDPAQCSRDADCVALGLRQTTCDTASKVCRVAAGGGAGLSGAAGEAGMPEAGAGQGGAANAGTGGASTAGGGNAAGSAGVGAGGSGNAAGSGAASGSENLGGTGGASSGGSADSGGSGGDPIPSWPTLANPASGVRVRVRSFCSGSLWMHLEAVASALTPDEAELKTGQEQDYNAPADWSGGRITAYNLGPGSGELEKVALTISGGVSYYSAQYIDGLGLPIEVVGFGGTCTADQTQACYAHQSDVATCPGFLKQGARCASASTYCLNAANQASTYCHALDGAISSCNGCPGGTTTDVYASLNGYANDAKWGAALNRGMAAQPDSMDASQFYQTTPYNTYAKWARSLCPNMLAFGHDDYNSTGPYFPSCDASELRITFCPAR